MPFWESPFSKDLLGMPPPGHRVPIKIFAALPLGKDETAD